jgi:hypothetical protein
LKNYKFEYDKEVFNADIIHELGIYIGNSQFIGKKHLSLLENILLEVKQNAQN